jgi:hypothetical protein
MAARIIEVFQPGCPVMIGEGVRAIITGVSIREHCYVQYECSWWNGRDHKCEWLAQIEVARMDESESIKLGFL